MRKLRGVAAMQRGAVAGQGPAAEVFATPAHACTKRLLDSIPGRGCNPPAAWRGPMAGAPQGTAA